MNFFPPKLIVMLAAATAAVSAPAQQQQQQTIVFSKPADMPAEKAKSYLPTISYRVGDFNAPHLLFNNALPAPPAPRPQLNNYNNAAALDALNRRKNWTLLTPEEILGIQTPEQILGLPDKNAGKKLSLEEQFLQRENKAASEAHVKDHPGGAAWRAMNDAGSFAAKEKPEEDASFRQPDQKPEPGTKFFNGFLNASGPEAKPDANQGSTWNTAFTQPAQPKPTTEQQADMERFRALMEPSPPPTPMTPTRFAAAPMPAPDPFLQAMPVVNPAGRGVAPLENSFSRPTGLQPLPGISTPPPAPAATRPSWQAQPPPWMQPGPPARPNWSY